MKVLLLTRHEFLGASSRVRSLQYVPYLESLGWDLDISPLFSDSYLGAFYAGDANRITYAIAGYVRRVLRILYTYHYDLVWIEKELFPFLPALFERILKATGVRYIVDYDDAVFHRYDQNRSALIRVILGDKIDRVMQYSSLVLVGNQYLADRAWKSGARRVEVVPSVVDSERYQPRLNRNRGVPVVGWIGTPKTCRYLYKHSAVWKRLASGQNVRFVAVGPSGHDLAGMPWETVSWSIDTEVETIRQFDVGIMPLHDSPWERGKCGYKLIQYMACGLPVVASPVGVNSEIVEVGKNGYLAESDEEWMESLLKLLKDPALREELGREGRRKVENWYSLQGQADRIGEMLAEVGAS